SSWRAYTAAGGFEDGGRHFDEGDDFLDAAADDGGAGHPEDDGRGLVLRDGDGAELFHLEEAIGAVVAHARQDHAYGVRPGLLGDRSQKDVDARPMTRHGRTVGEGHEVLRAAALDDHVLVAGRDERAPRDELVATLG